MTSHLLMLLVSEQKREVYVAQLEVYRLKTREAVRKESTPVSVRMLPGNQILAMEARLHGLGPKTVFPAINFGSRVQRWTNNSKLDAFPDVIQLP